MRIEGTVFGTGEMLDRRDTGKEIPPVINASSGMGVKTNKIKTCSVSMDYPEESNKFYIMKMPRRYLHNSVIHEMRDANLVLKWRKGKVFFSFDVAVLFRLLNVLFR